MHEATQSQGWPALRLANDELSVTVVPERGAKITSILDRRTGREWLWRDPRRPMLRLVGPSPDFARSDLSGFDECFPTVGACRYPGSGRMAGTPLADHGEVWFRPWSEELVPNGLVNRIELPHLACRLTRTLLLGPGSRLRVRYLLENLAEDTLVHGWSAHPLFAVLPGTRIVMPTGLPYRIEFGLGPRIHAGANQGSVPSHPEVGSWPTLVGAGGREWDLSDPSECGVVTDKVLVDTPSSGWVALAEPEAGPWLRMEVDATHIPFIGVCTNLGAWPPVNPQTWIALEPTFAVTDRVDSAHARGAAAHVPAGSHARWEVELQTGSGILPE